MTADRARGNFWGSFIDSVIGMTLGCQSQARRSNSQSDTFERKDGRADKEREVVAVEQHDVGDALGRDGLDLACRDIDDWCVSALRARSTHVQRG